MINYGIYINWWKCIGHLHTFEPSILVSFYGNIYCLSTNNLSFSRYIDENDQCAQQRLISDKITLIRVFVLHHCEP